MVLARVVANNIYEERQFRKPAIHFNHSWSVIVNILSPGNLGKDCLEAQKAEQGSLNECQWLDFFNFILGDYYLGCCFLFY